MKLRLLQSLVGDRFCLNRGDEIERETDEAVRLCEAQLAEPIEHGALSAALERRKQQSEKAAAAALAPTESARKKSEVGMKNSEVKKPAGGRPPLLNSEF